MSRFSKLSSERGAVLIQTSLAAFVLIGFSTFVVDYGVLWVARHQAQNAADAGAMAGALARAYEDFDDPPDPAGPAAQYAQRIAAANLVWGAPGAALVSFDGACPAEAGAPFRCVRTDVYRDARHGNALPAWFAPVLGLPSTQAMRATARAQVMIANGTNCLRPWAIPDNWLEPGGVRPTPADTFNVYDERPGTPTPGAELAPPHDIYQPPTAGDAGTGYMFATGNLVGEAGDFGASIPLTLSTDPSNKTDSIFPGWVVALKPAAGYAASVSACNGEQVDIDDQMTVAASAPRAADFNELFALDPGAAWDSANRTIANSCAPGCAPFSPRLVAIALFDAELFQYRRANNNWTICSPTNPGCAPCPAGACVTISNIAGFFIADAAGSTGYLTSYPGVIPGNPPKLTKASSFLKAITLVR